jgi:hypothetical protein
MSSMMLQALSSVISVSFSVFCAKLLVIHDSQIPGIALFIQEPDAPHLLSVLADPPGHQFQPTLTSEIDHNGRLLTGEQQTIERFHRLQKFRKFLSFRR